MKAWEMPELTQRELGSIIDDLTALAEAAEQ